MTKIFSELIYLPEWKWPLLANHTVSKDNIRLERAKVGKKSTTACHRIHTYSTTVSTDDLHVLMCQSLVTLGCTVDVAI